MHASGATWSKSRTSNRFTIIQPTPASRDRPRRPLRETHWRRGRISLVTFGQNHVCAVACHVGATEKAHTQKYAPGQTVLLNGGVDVVDHDIPDLDGIERDPVDRDHAIGCGDPAAWCIAISDPQAWRLTAGEDDEGRTGIDQKGDGAAIDLSLGDVVAPSVGDQRGTRATSPTCPVEFTQSQSLTPAIDQKLCAILVDREQFNAVDLRTRGHDMRLS